MAALKAAKDSEHVIWRVGGGHRVRGRGGLRLRERAGLMRRGSSRERDGSRGKSYPSSLRELIERGID